MRHPRQRPGDGQGPFSSGIHSAGGDRNARRRTSGPAKVCWVTLRDRQFPLRGVRRCGKCAYGHAEATHRTRLLPRHLTVNPIAWSAVAEASAVGNGSSPSGWSSWDAVSVSVGGSANVRDRDFV